MNETRNLTNNTVSDQVKTETRNETATATVKQTTNGQPFENCPQCRRELTGAIEVSEGIIGGISLVVMRETANRNWIVCDFCNRTVCKNCCVMPDSGCCDGCFVEYKLRPPY